MLVNLSDKSVHPTPVGRRIAFKAANARNALFFEIPYTGACVSTGPDSSPGVEDDREAAELHVGPLEDLSQGDRLDRQVGRRDLDGQRLALGAGPGSGVHPARLTQACSRV
jgi:hypothetical protein